MPCFTQTRMSVEFKAENFDLLETALKQLKRPVTRDSNSVSFYATHARITIRGGQIDMDERDREILNEVKRQYSRLVLDKAAATYGWALHEPTKNQFIARKR
jgi:hypothetical protein